MPNRPRLFNDGAFFSSAAATLQSGQYRYYENEQAPAFLQDERQQRTPSAHNCLLIVASAWNQGQIGGVTPKGTAYLVFEFSDHRHNPSDLHFNKDVKFYFTDQSGQGWYLPMNKDVDGHYIDAVATGTALPYLRSSYALPKKPEGTIQELLEEGTNIGPYPGK